MLKLLRVLIIAVWCCFCADLPARGQATPPAPVVPAKVTFDCSKEVDPVFSYCADINQFLADAAANKGATGKIDRTNPKVKSDLEAFLFVDSSPDRFSSLLASRIALQNAVSSLASPGNPAASAATVSGVTQNRQDQQTSAGSDASGTTGLVEKPGTSAIFALALESGALTRSVSGNTATLSGNADGLVRALTGQQVLCFVCASKGALGTKVLQNVNLSAAFLVDQQSSSSTSTSGAANPSTPASVTSVVLPTSVGKLSGITARYEVWNPYDPHSAKFLAAWNKAVADAKTQITSQATSFQAALVSLLNTGKKGLDNDAQFQAVLISYQGVFYDDADAQDLPKLRQDFLALYNATVDAWTKDDPQFNQQVAALNIALAQYRTLWQQILDNAKGQPLLTFEYAFNHPANQPETHDLRLIYAYAPQAGLGLLSVNAAVSLYGGTIPTGAKYGRLHDGQVSAEYDRPIAMKGNSNQATFSLAAYWQYQPDPSVLNITAGNLAPGTDIQLPQNAQVLLGTAGSLWVTQAKFTINGKSGVKIPFAFKWSNKTDLLSGNKIGAQVGLSYDFSSLSSLFGGSSGSQ
jgi:hypothetical protein